MHVDHDESAQNKTSLNDGQTVAMLRCSGALLNVALRYKPLAYMDAKILTKIAVIEIDIPISATRCLIETKQTPGCKQNVSLCILYSVSRTTVQSDFAFNLLVMVRHGIFKKAQISLTTATT